MSYNIHEGKGTDGTLDLNRIADVINAVGPDLVVLQEVDKNTEGSGFVDQPAVLAALTFMNHEFGKAMDWDKGEFGNVILTKHPYTLIGNYLLPKVKRNQEPRAALFLEVDLSSIYGPGASITFVGTHLDNRRAQSRIQAASFIDTILAGLPDRPALLGGDLNDVPGSPTMIEFDLSWEIEDLGQTLFTFPAGSPDRQIDYVLYRDSGAWTVNHAEVLDEPIASDHRPIVYIYELGTLPTARFDELCTVLTCQFTDTSFDPDGSVIAWSWDFGDSTTSAAQDPSHVYQSEGTYSVSLTVTDNDNNTDTTSHDVVVDTSPPPDITLATAGYKVKGLMKADLSWAEATSTNVDVYRDDVFLQTTANDGFFTDNIDQRGGGAFAYAVCEENTLICSNESSVAF
jgi:endonuclease/exonuclease/phosphatase family metal-dependent hydrolase